MNKRFYIIRDDRILLDSKNLSFPKPEIISKPDIAHQIPLHCKSEVNCFVIIPLEEWKEPESYSFFEINKLVRNNKKPEYQLAALAGYLCNWMINTIYCGRCGSKNEIISDEIVRKCSHCGFVQYPKISPAVIVAVTRDNKLLLAHNKEFKKGLYSLIAGFLNPGETFEQCVKREIREKVNIRVKNVRYFDDQPWLFPDSHMIGFTAEYESGSIAVDGKEIEHANWFCADNMPSIPAAGSLSRQMIDRFVEFQKQKTI